MDVLPRDHELRSGAELEYLSLREEAMRRSEQRQQLLSILVALAAAFLGVGWGTGGAVALLIFPPMAALLALIWAQNEAHIHRITMYIRDQLAPKIPGIGWEQFNRQRVLKSRVAGFPLDMLAVIGVFLVAQGLAVALALFRLQADALVQWLLLALAALSIGVVAALAVYLRRVLLR